MLMIDMEKFSSATSDLVVDESFNAFHVILVGHFWTSNNRETIPW